VDLACLISIQIKVSQIRKNTAGSKIKNIEQMKNTINNHTNNSIIFVS